MKITKHEIENKAFKPFAFTVNVETEEEARAWYAIFNNTCNSKLFPQGSSFLADEVVGEEFYVKRGVISNGITYNKYYNASF